ncbi:hypothetical protein BH09BAC1_BH09BAC1_12630 [soil metagenome]
MAIYNISVTDPSDIERLEALVGELQSARIHPLKNPASVTSKKELTERVNYGLQQIKNGETVVHEEVVEYMKKLKNNRE